MQVYIKKDAVSAPETNQNTRIVLDLAENIDNSCRNITRDNLLTDLLLVQKLLHKNLTLM